VALFAIVDEAGFQAGFDAGDDAFVDIRLALLAASGLDIDVNQPLTVDNGHAQFFCVRGVEQACVSFSTPLRLRRGALHVLKQSLRTARSVAREGTCKHRSCS
jgi:hypothetical protein